MKAAQWLRMRGWSDRPIISEQWKVHVMLADLMDAFAADVRAEVSLPKGGEDVQK